MSIEIWTICTMNVLSLKDGNSVGDEGDKGTSCNLSSGEFCINLFINPR